MADGLSVAVADAALTTIVGTDAVYVQLHTGAPGPAGTSNVSSVTTREATTGWGAASAGSVAASGTPTWTAWPGTSPETETDLSFWSLATSGAFGFSMQLAAPVTMNTGDSLALLTITVSIPTAS